MNIYLRLFDAKRHDSTSSIVALAEILKLYPNFNINSYVLDSASDNYPTYKYLNYLKINPIIALNQRNKTVKYHDGIYIDNIGTPVCKDNYKIIFGVIAKLEVESNGVALLLLKKLINANTVILVLLQAMVEHFILSLMMTFVYLLLFFATLVNLNLK